MFALTSLANFAIATRVRTHRVRARLVPLASNYGDRVLEFQIVCAAAVVATAAAAGGRRGREGHCDRKAIT